VTEPAARSPFDGLPPAQAGYVVRDLEEGLRRFSALWDAGEWRCWTYGPEILREQSYRGAPAAFSMRVALSAELPQIELIEPVEGPSVYHDWLEEHGEGLHHVAVRVASCSDAIAAMRRLGHEPVQHGLGFGADGTGGFAYFDVPGLAGLIEVVEAPARRRPPEFVWRAER
jgi:hypothetical protein